MMQNLLFFAPPSCKVHCLLFLLSVRASCSRLASTLAEEDAGSPEAESHVGLLFMTE